MSKIIFYRVNFKLGDNAFIDENFNSYLSSNTKIVLNDFQYVRNAETVIIRHDFSQDGLERFSPSSLGNYVSINNNPTDSNSLTYYYFITKLKQVAPETVELELTLDVLNTFPAGTFYNISERSIIQREHGSRFLDPEIYHPIVKDGIPYFRRSIDRYHAVAGGQLFKQEETELTEPLNESWYMIYKARNDITEDSQNIPLDVFFTTDADDLYLPASTQDYYELDALDVQRSDSRPSYEYFLGATVSGTIPSGSLEFRDSQNVAHTETIDSCTGLYLMAYGDQSTYTEARLFIYKYRAGAAPISTSYLINLNAKIKIITTATNNIKLIGCKIPNISAPVRERFPIQGTDSERNDWIQSHKIKEVNPYRPTVTTTKLDAFNTVNRTAQSLLKIIKLPYAPFDVRVDVVNNQRVLQLPEFLSKDTVSWTSGETARDYLKLKSTQGYLSKTLQPTQDIKLFDDLYVTIPTQDVRHDDNESKIFNSDYQYNKLVYDSFGYIHRLENVADDSTATPDTPVNIDYCVSGSMASRFLFRITSESDKDVEDYPDILAIARNNEVQLYNSSYLNYLRNGYNYDVKNKSIVAAQSMLGMGIGTVASILAQNYVGAGISLAGGLLSLTASQAQNENSLESRLQQLKEQGITVSGSDDVDLLTYYSNNRAKIVRYKASPKAIENALDKFYYYGYESNRIGAPTLKSRQWWNYVQAQIKTENEHTEVIPYLNRVYELWAQGVTVFHNGNAGDPLAPTPVAFDFSRTKANNELFIANYLRNLTN